MDKEKLIIPAFKRSGPITIQNWIKLFEKSSETKVADRPKLIPDYLDEEALNFFIEHNLYESSWELIKTKLIDYFSSEESTSIQEFLNLTLDKCETIEDYYRKKIDAGTKLKIEESFLIQILINGLPNNLKTLNLTRAFVTTSEWINFNKPLFYHLRTQEEQKKDCAANEKRNIPRESPGSQRALYPNQSPHPFRMLRPPREWNPYGYYRHSTPQQISMRAVPRFPAVEYGQGPRNFLIPTPPRRYSNNHSTP